MANGGLRISRPLRKRLTKAASNRRQLKLVKRCLQQNEKQAEERRAFLRDRGFVLPGEGIVLTDN